MFKPLEETKKDILLTQTALLLPENKNYKRGKRKCFSIGIHVKGALNLKSTKIVLNPI